MPPRVPKNPPVKPRSVNTVQTRGVVMPKKFAFKKAVQEPLSIKFWSSVWDLLDAEWREEERIKILSPRQCRKLALAFAGIKKFSYILKSMEEGYIYYPLSKDTYERHLHEWDIFGLVMIKGLEEKYLKKLRPKWHKDISWQELIKELKIIARRKETSQRFFELWNLYIRRNSLISFIEEMRPYDTELKSFEANVPKVMQRYIYAFWMHSKGYKGGRDKTALGNQLFKVIQDALDNPKTDTNRRNYYSGLISGKGGLVRTVTRHGRRSKEDRRRD